MKMNRVVKRGLGIILSLSMVLGSLYAGGRTARAEETLEANQEVFATVAAGATVTYNFVMPDKGYFYFRVVNKDASDFAYFHVSMMVNYERCESSNVWNEKAFVSSYYSYKPGTNVTITIDNSEHSGARDYQLCVFVENPSNFETEGNDTKAKADTIKAGKTYTGLIIYNDADWYVFKAPKTGKYKINAVNTTDGCVEGHTYQGSRETGSCDLKEGEGWKPLFSGKLKKGQKIYLKVCYDTLYSTRGVFYKIKVKKA